ncbi:flagellar biosynthetic protein FliR [Brytella acorum]|uniref:Flagellar biosynthetic protein FliR n=1 Tax=Brytella acorum TaxID=2959299 RepID=A0AA35VB91_9PROT|nr:flagellar biosynthetic protein FliR [Brytella acorum]MDF3624923.1 flagellar biosynthetic protein FliR [Brytella acorum]CAI9120229.1 flagellar biosynthetic protein FliR [Brytella acorum]
MSPAHPDALLAALPMLALCFALILCRVGAVVMLMPGPGESEIPTTVRAGIAVGLTFMVMPVAQASFEKALLTDAGPIRVLALAAIELLAGGLLGWIARLAAMILPVAGQVVSLLTGLSSVLQPDATLGAEAAIFGRAFSLLAPVILLTSGSYIYPIQALVGSYTLFPPGAVLMGHGHVPMIADSSHSIVMLTQRIFTLALQLVAPFLLLSLFWQVALGIMSRVIPNLQVYNLAMPLQIFGGIALAAILIHRMLTVWLHQATDILQSMPSL